MEQKENDELAKRIRNLVEKRCAAKQETAVLADSEPWKMQSRENLVDAAVEEVLAFKGLTHTHKVYIKLFILCALLLFHIFIIPSLFLILSLFILFPIIYPNY